MGYVYLIADDGGTSYKIGVTRSSVEKRLKQLSTGNSSELNTFDFYKTKYPYWIEKHLHAYFQEKHIRGEWFDLNDDDIMSFKDLCIKYEQIAESIKDNPYVKNNLH